MLFQRLSEKSFDPGSAKSRFVGACSGRLIHTVPWGFMWGL